jgi:hypothetical protein
MRHIIVHYHIFKNAGSSIDAILRDSFGTAWKSWDPGEAHSVFAARELAEFINAHDELSAISSHVARPPEPEIKNITIYPLFFVRHPVLRAASVYKYERSLKGETEAQRVAMNSSFAEYVRWRLRPEVEAVVRDFQTIYLSGEQLRYDDPRRAVATTSAFRRAMTLLEDLPVFGLVERFAESVGVLEQRLAHLFPQIKWREVRVNVTESTLGSLEEIESELGSMLYGELEAANRYDLALYEAANVLFNSKRLALTV